MSKMNAVILNIFILISVIYTKNKNSTFNLKGLSKENITHVLYDATMLSLKEKRKKHKNHGTVKQTLCEPTTCNTPQQQETVIVEKHKLPEITVVKAVQSPPIIVKRPSPIIVQAPSVAVQPQPVAVANPQETALVQQQVVSQPTAQQQIVSQPVVQQPTNIVQQPVVQQPTNTVQQPVAAGGKLGTLTSIGQPTQSPVQPTQSPVQPTQSPVQPTQSPVQPTKYPQLEFDDTYEDVRDSDDDYKDEDEPSYDDMDYKYKNNGNNRIEELDTEGSRNENSTSNAIPTGKNRDGSSSESNKTSAGENKEESSGENNTKQNRTSNSKNIEFDDNNWPDKPNEEDNSGDNDNNNGEEYNYNNFKQGGINNLRLRILNHPKNKVSLHQINNEDYSVVDQTKSKLIQNIDNSNKTHSVVNEAKINLRDLENRNKLKMHNDTILTKNDISNWLKEKKKAVNSKVNNIKRKSTRLHIKVTEIKNEITDLEQNEGLDKDNKNNFLKKETRSDEHKSRIRINTPSKIQSLSIKRRLRNKSLPKHHMPSKLKNFKNRKIGANIFKAQLSISKSIKKLKKHWKIQHPENHKKTRLDVDEEIQNTINVLNKDDSAKHVKAKHHALKRRPKLHKKTKNVEVKANVEQLEDPIEEENNNRKISKDGKDIYFSEFKQKRKHKKYKRT